MTTVLEKSRSSRKDRKGMPPPPQSITIDVDVTPVDQCAQMVVCDLDATPGGRGGSYVIDGVIFLANGSQYVLNFHLKNGPLGQFSWDTDPFWARKSKCPTQKGMPNGQFPSAPTTSGSTLTVGAGGVPGKSAIHYRLNMLDAGGNPAFCDPIVINN